MAHSMKKSQFLPPAVTSPQKLLQWFKAKKMNAVVLRIADLKELPEEELRKLIFFWDHVHIFGRPINVENPYRDIHYCLPVIEGNFEYLVFNVEKMCARLSIDDLEILQSIIFHYMEIRKYKGFPTVKQICDCKNNPACISCSGSGYVSVIDEISDDERKLSERKW